MPSSTPLAASAALTSSQWKVLLSVTFPASSSPALIFLPSAEDPSSLLTSATGILSRRL